MSHWYRKTPLVSSRLFAVLLLAVLAACTACIIWAGAPTS